MIFNEKMTKIVSEMMRLKQENKNKIRYTFPPVPW